MVIWANGNRRHDFFSEKVAGRAQPVMNRHIIYNFCPDCLADYCYIVVINSLNGMV